MRIPPFLSLRQTPLRTWLTLAVMGTMLVAVLSFAFVIERIARTHAERAALESLGEVAKGFAADLDRGMAHHFEQVQVLAGLDQVAEASDAASVRRALERLQTSFPQFTWIGLADPSGHVLASAGGLLEGGDVSMRPWFKGARAEPFSGDVHAAVLLEKVLPKSAEPWRFVDVAAPVRSRSGADVGVLGAHLSWSWAREVKTGLIATLSADHRIDAMVLGRDGRVLLGPAALEGKRWSVADAPGDFAVAAPTQGFRRYKGLGWTVVTRQPRDVAMADYRVMQRQIAFTTAVLLVLCIPFTRWLANRISSPLHVLTEAITQQEHLDGRALPAMAGYREVGLLGDALGALSQRQVEQDAALHELNESLEKRVEERTQQLVELTRHLEDLTRLDTLTGLPNRRLFEERLDLAMARAARTQRPMALLFLDVDRFKHINDTFGHGAGDDVLKAVAHRLGGSVRGTDTVARLGGDEFVVILEGLNHVDEAELVADKMLRDVQRELVVGGHTLQVSTSIGLTLYRGGPLTAPALVALADKALYEAKAAGRNTFRCLHEGTHATTS